MYKKTPIIAFLLLINTTIQAQKWEFQSYEDDFGREVVAASVQGTGLPPYNSPFFIFNVVDGELNIYIANAGYAGCDNQEVFIKFDKEKTIYPFSAYTNKNKESWFLEMVGRYSRGINLYEFVDKIKTNNNIVVRLESDCGFKDFKFSLNGSTAAIDKVISHYFKYLKGVKSDFIDKMNKDSIPLKTVIAKSFCYPYLSEYEKSIWWSDRILSATVMEVYDFNPTSEYYAIYDMKDKSIPIDILLYVKKKDVKPYSFSEIESNRTNNQ